MSDSDLLRRAQRGEPDAWGELYGELLPGAWAFALARCRRRCVAEEVVSDAFLALIKNLRRLDPDTCNLRAWMHTVVRSKVVDHMRRADAKDRALRSVHENGRGDRDSDDPVDEIIRCERDQRVLDLLDGLRDDHRVALQMKYAEGKTVREIAERMDLTEKATESLLSRAREDFRGRYEFREREDEMPRPLRAAAGPSTPGGSA